MVNMLGTYISVAKKVKITKLEQKGVRKECFGSEKCVRAGTRESKMKEESRL